MIEVLPIYVLRPSGRRDRRHDLMRAQLNVASALWLKHFNAGRVALQLQPVAASRPWPRPALELNL